MIEFLMLLNLTLTGLICPVQPLVIANVTIPQGHCMQAYGPIYYKGTFVGESLNLGCIKAAYTIIKANTTTMKNVYIIDVQAIGKGFLIIKVKGEPALQGYVNGPCVLKYKADHRELCLYYSAEVKTQMPITANGLEDIVYVNGKVERIGLMNSVEGVELKAICK